MSTAKLPGGPTQDEVLAVVLFKLGIRPHDIILDCGCGTGKVAIAMARTAGHVVALDRRKEAIRVAQEEAARADVQNIEFIHCGAADFLSGDHRLFDGAFVGGSDGISDFLPVLVHRVRRTLIVNAVRLSTLHATVRLMQDLGIFQEAVHIQVARSKAISGSIMFRPIDPVYMICGSGTAC